MSSFLLQEYCNNQDGRLCTKNELEDNCAAFMGCNFDTSLVWSSSEAEPISCPATSYSTCGDFITAFESLYNGRDTTTFESNNPMRINMDTALTDLSGVESPTFNNVRFPTNFNWTSDNDHGIFSYTNLLYKDLSNAREDRFCNAEYGPPSILAQACDESMTFLLGPKVSIGLLTSTAKAVNGE